jgi:Lrp/AsnC family leucine-responsive transcriptional regulator
MKLRKGKRIAGITVDATDLGIIEILTNNGRETNQDIAAKLSIVPATVSNRLNRLEDEKIMKVVAVTDFAAHGYNILIAIGVRVKGRAVKDVANDLAALREVFSVNIMHGRYNIEILVVLHEFSEMRLFLVEHVAKIPGIEELDPAVAAEIVKFEFNVAPL